MIHARELGLIAGAMGLALAVAAEAAIVNAVEFVGDHVFYTSNPAEIEALDSGRIPGWSRTGIVLRVNDSPDEGWVPVCRFYSDRFRPRSAHVFTAFAQECEALKAGTDWIYEGTAFYVRPVTATGNCPGTSQPVHRWYNDGRGGVPQHKFTQLRTDQLETPLLYSFDVMAMPAGWIAEGAGDGGVAFCTDFLVSSIIPAPPDAVLHLGGGRWTFTTASGVTHVDLSMPGPPESQTVVLYSVRARVVGLWRPLGPQPEAGYEMLVVSFAGRDTLEGCRHTVSSDAIESPCEFVVGRRDPGR